MEELHSRGNRLLELWFLCLLWPAVFDMLFYRPTMIANLLTRGAIVFIGVMLWIWLKSRKRA